MDDDPCTCTTQIMARRTVDIVALLSALHQRAIKRDRLALFVDLWERVHVAIGVTTAMEVIVGAQLSSCDGPFDKRALRHAVVKEVVGLLRVEPVLLVHIGVQVNRRLG